MAKQVLTLPNGQSIAYLLEHRARRTVGLKITNDGLVVHAPKRIFAFQLNQILVEKSNWILSKLQARDANKVDKIAWVDGEHLLYLGQDIQLSISPENTHKKPIFEQNILKISALQPQGLSPQNIPAKAGYSCVKSSIHGDYRHADIEKQVTNWYRQQAKLDFSRRLEILAAKLGVPTPPLTLSNAQSRWGSCNSRGQVRLSWRLLQAPPHIINYVICHELAHLKEMNHSARFYAVLAALFPNHKAAEKEIKALSPQLHRM